MLAAIICNIPGATGAARRFVKYDGSVTEDEREFWASRPQEIEPQRPVNAPTKPKKPPTVLEGDEISVTLEEPVADIVVEDEEIEELLAILVAVT